MTTAADVKQRQRAQWSGAAPGWDTWFDWYSRAFSPMMEWCCAATALTAGSRVLDVASGSGQPAITAAARVRPGGSVTATDISRDMLSVAERRAGAAGLDNIEFVEMDAEHLLFEPESFDAVTCTCGLMFFPDVAGALAEMRRVLEPRGRLAIAVWDDAAKSPFFTVAGQAVAKFLPPTPPDPKAPGAFRLSHPSDLAGILRGAGFQEVVVESVPMPVDLASPEEYWNVFTEMAAGIRARLDALPAPDRARLHDMIIEAAQGHVEGDRVRLAATALCASGRKQAGS